MMIFLRKNRVINRHILMVLFRIKMKRQRKKSIIIRVTTTTQQSKPEKKKKVGPKTKKNIVVDPHDKT